MAGFFGNRNKPGKGVDRDAPPQNAFIRYFTVFIRHFWSLSFVNLIYLIVLIPVVAACLGLLQLVFALGFGENWVLILLSFAPIILLAPANAGITKITRDFAREEPVFVWQDFWESAKKNLKQSLAVSTIGYIGAFVFTLVLIFYYNFVDFNNFLSLLPFVACLVLCVLFICAIFYMQLMVVTLDLKIKQIVKNSFILTIACFFKNLLCLAVCSLFLIIYAIVCFYSVASYGAIILMVALTFLIFFALEFYTVNFIFFSVIKQQIIDPYYEANPDKTAKGVLEKEQNDEEDATELPEYVYENGRMVPRSVIENTASIFEDKGKED